MICCGVAWAARRSRRHCWPMMGRAMDNGLARVRALGHKAHCQRLLAELQNQPAFVKALPLVRQAQQLAGESIELAGELLSRVPAEGGENGDAK